jgi:CheY-like chemotaxis protein
MNARILVVDDNPTNLKLAADVMEMEGYTVDRAMDGEQALSSIQSHMPDLILMDVALPKADGLTLTRQLKASGATRHIPIIAMTAFAMRGDEEDAREAGCDGYITKPIDTRRLPIQVAEMLGLAKATENRERSQ